MRLLAPLKQHQPLRAPSGDLSLIIVVIKAASQKSYRKYYLEESPLFHFEASRALPPEVASFTLKCSVDYVSHTYGHDAKAECRDAKARPHSHAKKQRWSRRILRSLSTEHRMTIKSTAASQITKKETGQMIMFI